MGVFGNTFGNQQGSLLLNYAPAVLRDGHTVVVYDYTRLDKITKNGFDIISRVNDVFNSGKDLISGHAQWTPDGILFDNATGILDYLKTSSFTLNQPICFYVVFKQISWLAGRYILDGNTAGSVYGLQSTSSPTMRFSAGQSGYVSNMNIGEFGILRILFNGTDSQIQVNNNAPTTLNLGTTNMGGITLGVKGDILAGTFSNIMVKQVLVRDKVDDTETINTIYTWLNNKMNQVQNFNAFADSCDGNTIDTKKWDIYVEDTNKIKVTQNNALEMYSCTNDTTSARIISKVSSKTGVFTFSAFSLCAEQSYSPSRTRFGLWIDSKNKIEFYHKLSGSYNISYRIVKDGTTVYEVDNLAKEFIQVKIIVTNTQISAYMWTNDAWVQIGTTQTYSFGAKRIFMNNNSTTSRGAKVSLRDVYIVENDFSTVTPVAQSTISATNIRSFGAIPDGATDNASAINTALQSGNVIIDNGTFAIGSSILIPSNRTLYIRNAKIKLLNASYDNMFRNSDLVNGNTNINVLGLGNAILDGNGANNAQPADFWLPNNKYKKATSMICKTSNFEISNINNVDRFSYFMQLQDATYGSIHDIHFNHYTLDESMSHHDGISVAFGSHDIDVYKLKGISGDDFSSIYSGGSAFLYSNTGSMTGEVYNIKFHDFIPTYAAGHAVDLIVGNQNKVHDIEIYNMEIPDCDSFVQLGYIESGVPSPAINDQYNIIIKDSIIRKSTNPVVKFSNNMKNVTVTNITNNSASANYYVNPAKQLLNVTYEGTILDQNNT